MDLNKMYGNPNIFQFTENRSLLMRDSDSDDEVEKKDNRLRREKTNTKTYGSSGNLSKLKKSDDEMRKSTDCLAAPTKERQKKKSDTNTPKDMVENIELAKALINIDFPLKDTHIFSLACKTCFTKISEGPMGCHLEQQCINCERNKLVVKKIKGEFWTEIRKRPAHNRNINYQECFDFKRNKACINNQCTYPHGEAELNIWYMEQNKSFSLSEFITVLKRHNIGTNELLQQKKKKFKFVPGLVPTKDTNSDTIQSKIFTKPVFSEANKNTENILYPVQHNGKSKCLPRDMPQIDPALEPVYESQNFQNCNKNPLYRSHNYGYFCLDCISKPYSDSLHRCSKHILAFAKKETSNWLIVRNRKKFINSNYELCISIENKDKLCTHGQTYCAYAHNNVEKLLWNLEKDNKFLINSLRSKNNPIYFGFVTSKHGFNFDFICAACMKNGLSIGQNSENPIYCNSNSSHLWEDSKLVLHSLHNNITYIRKPSTVNHDYMLCQVYSCNKDNCSRAHSLVERDTWMVLRDQNISMEAFVNYCKSAKNNPPHMLYEFCKICFHTGKKLTHSQCQHDKLNGSIYITKTSGKKINPIPNIIPSSFNFFLCNFMKNNKCTKNNIKCTFAHCNEEIEIWKWMCNNNVKSLEECVRLQNQSQKDGRNSLELNKTKESQKGNNETPSVSQLQFIGKEGYSSTANCWGNVNEPPVNEPPVNEPPVNEPPALRKNPKLYQNGIDGNALLDSSLAQEIRKMMKKPSKNNKTKPIPIKYYTDIAHPISEKLPDIEITMNTTSTHSSENKDYTTRWCFDIVSFKYNLWNVLLLTKQNGEQFFLTPTVEITDHAREDFKIFKIAENKWKVPVIYTGDASETFSVKFVFDFGMLNLLYYPIEINISPTEKGEDLKNRQMTISKLSTNTLKNDTELDHLMNIYNIPNKVECLVLNEHNMELRLSRDNYVETMHTLLYVEEFTCRTIISSYNLKSEMKISTLINDNAGTMLNAVDGSLYGNIHFPTPLSCNTDSGNLILQNCQEVHLFLKSDKDKFYEIPITRKENCRFNGLHQDTLYLTFSKELVKDLKLANEKSVDVEIHFKFNRSNFLKMHHALDNLKSTEIVFPNTDIVHLENENQDYSSTHLNEDQVGAVKHILSKGMNSRPPFVIIGPFGTGKTETLVSAITEIVKSDSAAKILICTHTNSAADLFIIKHLHKFLSRNKKSCYMKRMYFKERRWETINPIVQKYIFQSEGVLKYPNMNDLQSTQILITTMGMCYELMKMKIQGFFSHIFIDEAAQTLESMVLLPLSLASEKTCIVLSGDPNQIGQEVYSTKITKNMLPTSIVKRLYDYYKEYQEENEIVHHPPYILLKQNYRSCKEIVNFLAYSVYGLSHEMTSQVKSPVSDMRALQFYSVEGSAESLLNDVSYYNNKEAVEVCTVVEKVINSWPDKEDCLKPEEICIISNQMNQVRLIRKSLRRQLINVELVTNVQGKQFKVVIISTVLTTSLVSSIVAETCKANFLNNKLLVNTAMSRAKYVLIVVGDPVALCLAGECKYTWQNFIQNCSEMESLYPAQITYDIIHSKVIKQLNDISQEKYATGRNNSEMKAVDCMKHYENPEICFPLIYAKSTDDFKNSIIDAIFKEALLDALETQDFIFPNIFIVWDNNQGHGEFCIQSSVLDAWNMELQSAGILNSAQKISNVPDWFCVKYNENESSKLNISKTPEAATYFLHVWVTDVKIQYENAVVKVQVIESEMDILKRITDKSRCSLQLISVNSIYRSLINSLTSVDTIPPLAKMYVNEFDKIPKRTDKKFLPNVEIMMYESLRSGIRISYLTEWLYDASVNMMASGEYQIIVCSHEESMLDALENQLRILNILKNCDVVRVADARTEDIFFEEYLQSTAAKDSEETVPTDSQDHFIYLHERLMRKNVLFKNYIDSIKSIVTSGMKFPLETNMFKENLLSNSPIILCTLETTSRTLFRNLNKKKMIVIADAANYSEWPVLLPLLLNNIQNMFLFTTTQ